MGGRVVEGSGLENRRGCKLSVGSNPTPSATLRPVGLRVAGHQKNDRARVSPEAPSGAQGGLLRVWYIYFLELKNGDVYVGSTNDLRRRVNSHQSGQVISTKHNLPAVLRSYVAVMNEANARRLERYFKSGSGKAFAKKRFLATD